MKREIVLILLFPLLRIIRPELQHIPLPTRAHTRTHTHTCTHAHTHMHTRTHTHTHAHTRTHTHTHTRAHTHTLHCIHTHTRAHAHTHTHTPIQRAVGAAQGECGEQECCSRGAAERRAECTARTDSCSGEPESGGTSREGEPGTAGMRPLVSCFISLRHLYIFTLIGVHSIIVTCMIIQMYVCMYVCRYSAAM